MKKTMDGGMEDSGVSSLMVVWHTLIHASIHASIHPGHIEDLKHTNFLPFSLSVWVFVEVLVVVSTKVGSKEVPQVFGKSDQQNGGFGALLQEGRDCFYRAVN